MYIIYIYIYIYIYINVLCYMALEFVLFLQAELVIFKCIYNALVSDYTSNNKNERLQKQLIIIWEQK